MKIIYLKKTHRDIHITIKKKYLHKRKYTDDNSGTLQTIFQDGAGLKEELLDVHNTEAVIELIGKHHTDSRQTQITITPKRFMEWNNPTLNFNWSKVEFTNFSHEGLAHLANLKQANEQPWENAIQAFYGRKEKNALHR